MYKKTAKKVFLTLTLGLLAALLPLMSSTNAAVTQTEDGVKYEFEDGIQDGAKIYTDYKGETDDGTAFDLSGATCSFIGQKGTSTSVNVQIDKAGLYELVVRYAEPFDPNKKVQYLNVNAVNQGEVSFAYSLGWKEISAGIVKLDKGTNNIEFDSYWGYTFFDYLIVKPADESLTNLKVDKTLVNPNATKEAKSLMSYLVDVYGKHIISGQQELCGSHNYEGSEAEFTYIKEKTGKMPALRGFDFMNYRGNGLLWDDYCAERVIEWYKEKNGIPTVCWHWFSPANIGKKADNSFYTESTTFSISKALTPGTAENTALLNDIEFMAGKFKQLQNAGVPVLFRPLHEAEGAWFWWGAEGPEPCVKLYRLLYEKFTNEYKLNNIIWVWTSYAYDTSSKWYPGDDVVDIVGYDKYNAMDGKPNGSAIASTFYSLVKLTDGNKLVTMSENDSIPQVSNLTNELAGWLYFCPWYGWYLTGEQNNPVDWLTEIYKSDYCITLDELPDLKSYPYAESTIMYGDLNGDKSIDSIDFALMKSYLLGSIKEFSVSSKAADLNADDSIDSLDFSYLKRYLLGDISKFPAG
ncbi:mannan endo-1,4-beta-mannosidase [Ruminiclostridium sufflavum DSM 19573]|uniref:cellulase n=1 Tax=Ruminiclostridium sufflavum DSM 19573 TaxID=1121337 RepID=A0A318XTM4_9FIRM|nr:glycosyl hydrolase [Ruminiclostridium sufflavum]PYG90193.1 mannan endo-1,4-beta-mannosidase [Ruminiclostridium sufflavum DSM 19573]